MPQSMKERHRALIAKLESDRQMFEPLWDDVGDYILPFRWRNAKNDVKMFEDKMRDIINKTATMSAHVLSAGMHSGITNPARPWVKLTTEDSELSGYEPSKEWLSLTTKNMLGLFQKSNLYNTLPTLYSDESVFAVGAMGMFEHPTKLFRFETYEPGSFWLAQDEFGIVNTFCRKFDMTVRQIVHMFGDPNAKNDKDRFANISMKIKNAWDRGDYEEKHRVVHLIEPNDDPRDTILTYKSKRFISCYFEESGNDNKYLRISGYNEFPVLCPRWQAGSMFAYGTNSPGFSTIGEIKSLQTIDRRVIEAANKMVNPPLVAPVSMLDDEVDLSPGKLNFVADSMMQYGGIRSLHDVRFDINAGNAMSQQKIQAIRRHFMEDLFLMLTLADDRERTAREVAERHEEKMLMLGPVLQRQDSDLLDPLVERAFAIMARKRKLPAPPPELAGQDLKIEYISILAQAQKMVSLSGIEQVSAYSVQLASVDPSVLDKIKFDQMLEDYADAHGVNPAALRSDEEVAIIREQRAMAQAQAMQQEQMESQARSANLLANSNMESDNALSRLAQGVANAG